MVPSEGTELKRRKQVNVDEISRVNSLVLKFTLPVPIVLHEAPFEADIDVQWETCDTILPIESCITNQLIPMECNMPSDWSFDIHLIEVDDVYTDVEYSNIDFNGTVLKSKQDTGTQINVMSKVIFHKLPHDHGGKLPLYPRTCTKLVGYSNQIIDYLGTTKIRCQHNRVKTEAVFYVTDVQDSKIILGL